MIPATEKAYSRDVFTFSGCDIFGFKNPVKDVFLMRGWTNLTGKKSEKFYLFGQNGTGVFLKEINKNGVIKDLF